MRAKGVPWSDAVALTADVTVPIFAVKEFIIIMVPLVNIVIIIIGVMTGMIINDATLIICIRNATL